MIRWDGKRLVDRPAPGRPAGRQPERITVENGTVWAAGEKHNPLSGYWQPFIMRAQDGSWTRGPAAGRVT